MKILALDQASKTSGYSIWNDNELVSYGKFTFDDDDIGQRLMKIRNKVKTLITENDIGYVIMEDIQVQQNNVQTFKVLAEVFGVIYELVTEMGIPNHAVLSSVWKSVVGIKGRARPEQKRNAQQHVTDTYGIKATQDESDAICIGEYYIKKHLSFKEKVGFDWS